MFAQTIESQHSRENDEWAERSEYWADQVRRNTPDRKRRERCSTPLIVTGQGISIRVDKGALVIDDGFTHFPSDKVKQRFFPGDLALPTRIVLLDGSGSVTLDAIDWLSERNVPLIRLNWDGKLSSVLAGSAYPFDREKVEWQLKTAARQASRTRYATKLIREKLTASLGTLQNHLPDTLAREQAIRFAREVLGELTKVRNCDQLLAREGPVATMYFRAWSDLEMKWKGLNQHPIPVDWKDYKSRSALRGSTTRENVRATHPINAMLNYAYGMLEIRTRIRVLAEGFDPAIGILHAAKDKSKHSFVFDHMEPFRPIADQAVLAVIAENVFSPGDFTITAGGTCRLNPVLARRVVQAVERVLPDPQISKEF